MTKSNLLLLVAAAGLALAGCNQAESPAQVQEDVADARAEAQRDVTEAQAVEGLGAVAGGAGSASSNTVFVESASGIAEGARTGLASVV